MRSRWRDVAFAVALTACSGSDRAPAPECTSPSVRCGERCVDTSSDRGHCGACGVACPEGRYCIEGRCLDACRPGQTACGDACVDLMTDRRHCGACGNVCGGVGRCTAGLCDDLCAPESSPCGLSCDALARDDRNCGACGTVCPAHQRCEAGRCVDRCADGSRWCGDRCADLQRDTGHCGACGIACPPGGAATHAECFDGRCMVCPHGTFTCDPLRPCAAVAGSRENCHGCGVRCAEREVCRVGGCVACPAGASPCGESACADLSTDPLNCGACGRLCADTEWCRAGRCEPCGPNARRCGSSACQTLASARQCGACGHACGPNQWCVGGACEPCPTGTATCPWDVYECRTSITTPENCGACGRACPEAEGAGVACVAGECRYTCRPGLADCDGVAGCETESARDNANCGACGRACPAQTRCTGGRCVAANVRPLRPLSMARLSTLQPSFAWTLEGGLDGARIELCATRRCDVVTERIDVVGSEHTLARPLTPGIHYWRLIGRRGEILEPQAGVVWMFVAEHAPGPLTPQSILAGDYNADGATDGAVNFGLPVSTCPPRGFIGIRYAEFTHGAIAIGDADGDGFGDAYVLRRGSYYDCTNNHTHAVAEVLLAFGSELGLGLREPPVLVSDSIRPRPPFQFEVPTIEDFDGDGRTDHVWRSAQDAGIPYWSYEIIVHGGSTRLANWQPEGPPSISWITSIDAAGDFDGDHASELAVAHASTEYAQPLGRVRGSSFEAITLPRCEDLAARPLAPTDSRRRFSVVSDFDRDGFIDIVTNARTDDGRTVGVRYLGGRGAPRGDRDCVEALPP